MSHVGSVLSNDVANLRVVQLVSPKKEQATNYFWLREAFYNVQKVSGGVFFHSTVWRTEVGKLR